jgi:hypothetical protein
MAEWSKAPPWKGGIGVTLSRVRIPLSPPLVGRGCSCQLKHVKSFVLWLLESYLLCGVINALYEYEEEFIIK